MLPDYEDITSRVDETPQWWDENGTPRYGEFHPNQLGVYDDYAILVRIACQNCGKKFDVAKGKSSSFSAIEHFVHVGRFFDLIRGMNPQVDAIEEIVWEKDSPTYDPTLLQTVFEAYKPSLAKMVDGYHYGDPPRHDAPDYPGCAGDTMNCLDIKVLQAWSRHVDFEGKNFLTGPEYAAKDLGWRRFPEYEIDLDDA